jgi:hypothetical protein
MAPPVQTHDMRASAGLAAVAAALSARGAAGAVLQTAWANNTALGPASAGLVTTPPNVNAVAGFCGGDWCSARIVGQVLPPATEYLSFTVTTDGGVRLWVDDHLMLDSYPATLPTLRNATTTYTLPVTAGQPVPFRLEYTHYTGPSTLVLWWAGNTTALAVIPPSGLSSNVSAAEATRQGMRDRMYAPANAWGTYYNPTMGAHVQVRRGAGWCGALSAVLGAFVWLVVRSLRGCRAVFGAPCVAVMLRAVVCAYVRCAACGALHSLSGCCAMCGAGRACAAAAPCARPGTTVAVLPRRPPAATACGSHPPPPPLACGQLPSAFALVTTLVNYTDGKALGDIIVFRDAKPAVTSVRGRGGGALH